eukprot:s490_g31.t1
MDPQAQRAFIQEHMDSDLQFILGESGVALQHQVAIARHYGNLRKFSALGDDRPTIRTACFQDFAITNDTPENRSQIAAIVSAWETSKEYLSKEVELKAEAKVMGQPKILQIHERQAMLRAVEAVHGTLGDSECPSSDYLSLKAEETEANEPTASPLDEILSKLASQNSQIQTAVDNSGHIRVTRTKNKAKMPSTTEEYRKVMKVEMYAWLALASRYKSKHWLHGLTADPFIKFVEFILGDRVYGIQIPTNEGTQQRVRPDWAIVLAYEQRLRKECMKKIMEGHTFADSLIAVTKDADLKEAYFTTPVALRAAATDSQPSKWQRFNSKGSGFSGKSSGSSFKGKSKGKGKFKSSNQADARLKGLNLAWRTPDGRELCFAWNSGNCDGSCGRVHQCRVKGCYADHKAANFFVEQCLRACECAGRANGYFFLEHPEDLGLVEGEHPGSIWQWQEVLDLIPKFAALCFAIHQCRFGALTPKPTRLLTNIQFTDSRCYFSLPKFDKDGYYKGPLPRKCGHRHSHKLIGKTGQRWNTSPSAAYPPAMCEFIARLVVDACGRGGNNKSGVGLKRSMGQVDTAAPSSEGPKRQRVDPQIETGVIAISDDESVGGPQLETDEKVAVELDAVQQDDTPMEEFDMQSCRNAGAPIQVEWDQSSHSFIDGFGLCSPTRWRPQQRGERRTPEMVGLANASFEILADTVRKHVVDVRREAFKLVTGKLEGSPFAINVIEETRSALFGLLPDPADAQIRDEGQPFYLRAMAQWLKKFEDPDAHWLVDEADSFASGVFVGVDKPLPRSPQVFPLKTKHRKMDETEFSPIADNYPSAQMSADELEKKFREEELLGRMHPSKLGVLKQEYGDRLRVASMAAISKPDGTVRPLHDATHSVMVNHHIRYQDKILCPGPAEIAAIVREASDSGEAPFCVSADIKAAHRLVKVRRQDWCYLCCRANSSSDTVWVNRTGTFGVSSAPYWWAKLAAMLGRFVGYMFHTRWMMQMIYVDDLHGTFAGPDKFLFLWVWLLAFEVLGTPFGYHKFKGGFSSEFVGFHLRYDLSEVGISKKRGDWLVNWINTAASQKFVVSSRDFVEFLGRLGFVAQLLVWLKPHLSPLYSWAAVTARSTVGRLPETVILTLEYILRELKNETYMVSTRRPKVFSGDQFRTDAKCADGYVVLAGWELQSKRWFAVRVGPADAPFLFKPTGESQWASTSAELLASVLALKAFGWLVEGRHRKSLQLALVGGTDNKANEALTSKRATTRWPLMAINMMMSSLLARARLSLSLNWRPRAENVEADDLTNERFEAFEPSKRVVLGLEDLDMSLLLALVETHSQFEQAKVAARRDKENDKGSKSKKFDKSPW